jgi:hypothetical protein
MRKILFIFTAILSFSLLAGTQMINLAQANPSPLHQTIAPEITIQSPVLNQTYPANDVWLNFTVSRPSTFINSPENQSDGYWSIGSIQYVEYGVDSYNNVNETTRIQVNDPMNATNPAPNNTFSINLKGLQDGQHTVIVQAVGQAAGVQYNTSSPITKFTVYTQEVSQGLFTTVNVAIASGAITLVVAAAGLLLYFKKNEHAVLDKKL